MLKKKVDYIDFNGEEQSEVLYFNLTEPEVVRLDVLFKDGLEAHVNKLNDETHPEDILKLFEKLLTLSYGEKSEDGRTFIKTAEKSMLFTQSAAYSALFMELVQNVDEATNFFNNLLSRTTVEVEVPKPKKE